jgi:hypothetical protein
MPHHGSNERIRNSYRQAKFHPDHRGLSRFACENAVTGDLIVATDMVAHYAYCPRADYQFTSSRKRDAEGWIGVPSLHTPAELVSTLHAADRDNVWLVLSGREARSRKSTASLGPLQEFLAKLCVELVYEGADEGSQVLLLDRECVAQLREELR